MKRIRIGVFGAGRGMDIARNFMLLGCDIVALCDNNTERREQAAKTLDSSVAVYDNFDAFIEHDMDAMIVANYFHEHAPYAIRCFEKGIHVFSECISNGTMAEGIELLDAFEKSKSIYMLAENYPQMLFNREIKRICSGGTLGKILYAEGEYNHPGDPFDVAFKKRYNYFEKHWRNYLPRAYYVTHSLGPIMWATGATPKKVTAFSVFDPITAEAPTASNVGDRVSIITTQNDDGSVFRFVGCAAFGAHHNAYRVCGVNGQIENLRGMGAQVMLRYNSWTKPTPDTPENSLYTPDWNDADEEIIKTSGHGGGDYLTARMFLDCIRENRQPEHPFDIYSAVNMSSVAILAHRSVLNGGVPYDIPDFRTEEARAQYKDDRETPFYGENGTVPTIPCCTNPDFKPTEKQVELFREVIK
ncbi:MAG: Gfo/Idh/MocA family oxidoreductase [Clostridia bacterium]|nr:Gfo/Idh/MocA family oxidoreductase [Clostridia bacterium]